MKFDFKCPKCGAEPHKHGAGQCDYDSRTIDCEGLICECEDWEDDNPLSEQPGHGETLSNPCKNAHCCHCDWSGTVPKKPAGLQSWEKKALEAGWTMPKEREEELKLSSKK